MTSQLYSTEILRLAAATGRHPRLDAPHGTSEQRSPTCGSRLTVDVRVDAVGAVSAVGLELSACALGQASAALMAQSAIGLRDHELAAGRDALCSWLKSEAALPDEWGSLSVFEPARSKSARHPAIMLAFDGVVEAVKRAKG